MPDAVLDLHFVASPVSESIRWIGQGASLLLEGVRAPSMNKFAGVGDVGACKTEDAERMANMHSLTYLASASPFNLPR